MLLDVILYGAGAMGYRAMKSIEDKYDNRVLGFADSFRTGKVYGYPIIGLDGENQAYKHTAIVITIFDKHEVEKVYFQLKERGYQRIYTFLPSKCKTYTFEKDFLKSECVVYNSNQGSTLKQAEMHIADHCNLNCKGCAHFSPLFEDQLPCLEKRMEDVRQLKKLVSSIHIFALLGGEPLLNPEIKEYIIQTREILTDTEIWIVTNGLLIPKIDESILQCMAEYRVVMVISEYKPTRMMIDEIIDRLQKAKVDYIIRPYDRREKFYKPLSLKINSRYPNKCISLGCVNIWDGKIARCPTLMYIEKFNETFGTNLPAEGIMELGSAPSGKELVEVLSLEVPLCKHCVDAPIDWEICGKPPRLEDFAWNE